MHAQTITMVSKSNKLPLYQFFRTLHFFYTYPRYHESSFQSYGLQLIAQTIQSCNIRMNSRHIYASRQRSNPLRNSSGDKNPVAEIFNTVSVHIDGNVKLLFIYCFGVADFPDEFGQPGYIDSCRAPALTILVFLLSQDCTLRVISYTASCLVYK